MRTLNQRDFALQISRDEIRLIRGEGRIIFTPAEADKVIGILNTAAGMEQLIVLPPYIDSTPWRITFHEDNSLSLLRKDGSDDPIKFSWREIQIFQQIVEQGKKICLDQRTLRPGPRLATGFSALNDGAGQIIEE